MDQLLQALEELSDELKESKRMCDERDRDGGEARVDFLDRLDDLIPELADLCRHRWALEQLLRLCRMRENRA